MALPASVWDGRGNSMRLSQILGGAGCLAGVALAYRWYGGAGVIVAASALVMWLLLHVSRMMQILRRAADRPVGWVDSAVMLNAKLQPGMTLLHVIAMTRALGRLQSEKDVQPEVFRWTDGGGSHVTGTFVGGKLAHHALFRPAAEGELPGAP